MKRIKRRAGAALILAGLSILGLAVFIFQMYTDGGAWAAFPANQSVFASGLLNTGTITDRSGVVLASAGNGERTYADDARVRAACLHAVGDFSGNIGTGALTRFRDRLIGYDFVDGTYKARSGGAALTLTLDSRLNAAANEALAGRKGAVMVMDYTTGEILCMVSSPNYDPANVPDLSSSQYDGAFLNRCISSTYTPGSVFKLVTLAAAIENIPDLYGRSFYCGGSVSVGGVAVNCSGIHGSQTIEQALANSCNCVFAEISLELGADTLEKYAAALGFTENHDLNGIQTAAGSFDKARAGSSDLAWSGIGQYTDLVSPYAMLRYVGAVANGGSIQEPTLVYGEETDEARLLSASTAGKIADMMNYNVVYGYGEWRFPGLKLCGKSGTAEVGSGASHAWFTGFLQDPDHPYAFVVVIEHGGGGLANAGAVANAVLQAAVFGG